MNKRQLTEAIAKELEVSNMQAGRALEATLKTIAKVLKSGESVNLIGFGAFSVVKRAARMGRNPQTGAQMKLAAKKVAKFKASAKLIGGK
jgi:DNA-binding protein HU-beta